MSLVRYRRKTLASTKICRQDAPGPAGAKGGRSITIVLLGTSRLEAQHSFTDSREILRAVDRDGAAEVAKRVPHWAQHHFAFALDKRHVIAFSNTQDLPNCLRYGYLAAAADTCTGHGRVANV